MEISKLLLLLSFMTIACRDQKKAFEREPWIDEPFSTWPDFALTNKIIFSDTTYSNLGNSFLINTGYDTLGATCKHLFLVFKNNGINAVDLGENFRKWFIYPKGQTEKNIELGELINTDPNEKTGEFNTLKDRDWIIFNLKRVNPDIYPLKVRYEPLRKGEIIYAIGWAMQQVTENPSVIKMKVFSDMGNYFYVQTLTGNVDPRGRSGSPVIDSNGLLVGLVSGAEGQLGVIGSTRYLMELLKKHHIEY